MYRFQAWAKVVDPFLQLGGPVWRCRVSGKRWLYTHYGVYLSSTDPRIAQDRLRLVRCGFVRVELIKLA